MQDFDKINPLNRKDRELLSNLKSTFDLGTKAIIGQEFSLQKIQLKMDTLVLTL